MGGMLESTQLESIKLQLSIRLPTFQCPLAMTIAAGNASTQMIHVAAAAMQSIEPRTTISLAPWATQQLKNFDLLDWRGIPPSFDRIVRQPHGHLPLYLTTKGVVASIAMTILGEVAAARNGPEAEDQVRAVFDLTSNVAFSLASLHLEVRNSRMHATKMLYLVADSTAKTPGWYRVQPHLSHFVVTSESGAIFAARYPEEIEHVRALIGRSDLQCTSPTDRKAVLTTARSAMLIRGLSPVGLRELVGGRLLHVLLDKKDQQGGSVLAG